MTNQPQTLESRYGRGRRAKRDRALVIGVGGVLGIALVVWIFVVAFTPPATSALASGQVISFKANSNISSTLKVLISKPATATVVCQVSALNEAGSSVGSKQFQVATAGKSVSATLQITTTEPSTQGLVDFCHLK
jgi:Domain of unknown function (DUF4307)